MTSRKSLLLVDDDPLVLATTGHGLRGHGYDVTAVGSADDALKCAADGAFDLAILDVRLPGMSGLDLGHVLRHGHGLACIYLSAYSDDACVADAIRIGALTYVVKPIAVSRMVPAIEAALARAREIGLLAEQRQQFDRALSAARHTSVAIGMLMAMRGMSEKAAFELLRAAARRQRRKLDGLCRELVESRRLDAIA